MAGKGNPKGVGRRPGSLNKVTADVKALAQEYGPKAIEVLAHIMVNGETEPGRVAASKEILDRAYGKSRQAVDVDGDLRHTVNKIVRTVVRPEHPDR